MVKYVNDIAGIRVICSFTSDIYRIAEMIGKQNDLTVISVKDYINNPKFPFESDTGLDVAFMNYQKIR